MTKLLITCQHIVTVDGTDIPCDVLATAEDFLCDGCREGCGLATFSGETIVAHARDITLTFTFGRGLS